MDYDEVEVMRPSSAALKLLRADNAALVLSFLSHVFVEDNIRSISRTDLVGRLDDELYGLNERMGEQSYPRSAAAYLDDWAAPESGWLRKHYPPNSDEKCTSMPLPLSRRR